MATLRKTLNAGVAGVLLMTGLAIKSHGEVVSGGASFGPGSETMMRIRGSVVCTACSLEEVRKGRPYDNTLYQLTYRQGRLVLQVNWVTNPSRWDRIVWPPRLYVRGDASLLHQLTAEEHLFKEVEITGLLSNTRTLDLTSVDLKG